MEQKTVLILTDYVLAKTGFGKNARAIFNHLYKSGKYKLVNLAVGMVTNNPDLNRTPWKTIGTVNPVQIDQIKKQNQPSAWETLDRLGGYGAFAIDEAVKQEKPDVVIAIQDIWGIDFCADKAWFNKIPSVLWTTLDSLPILPKAVELAPKVKNYWSWADFATQDLHKQGFKHVRTVRGAIETVNFHRLSDKTRFDLRQNNGIQPNAFIVGFVFRNQLRKSVPNMIQGFKMFKNTNPEVPAKLLFHTSWTEGWDIPKLIKENDLKPEDILTTYVCRHCNNYEIKPFTSPETDCKYCKSQKSQVTTSPVFGVTEKQLNEIYNLMDVYCHPFTSGGQEIPVQEAKLTELVTLVTNYSCGEDLCVEAANSLPLEWAEYREPGTQFIKASTYPFSIAKQLSKVLNMKDSQRREMGKKARQWVLDNFSVEVIGKTLEEFIDLAPISNYNFDEKPEARDAQAVIPSIEDNEQWLEEMYKKILKRKERDDNGVKYWLNELKRGTSRQSIETYFRKVAMDENQKNNPPTLESVLNPDDKGRVLFVIPESAGDVFLSTALFKSIKERYPDWTLYVATKPQFKDILEGNPHMDKWIEYNPFMDNLILMEGNNTSKGFFNIAYLPHIFTQRILGYLHNGQDKIDFNCKA